MNILYDINQLFDADLDVYRYELEKLKKFIVGETVIVHHVSP